MTRTGVANPVDDLTYERTLDAKAVRFGAALAAFGVAIIVFALIDPTLTDADRFLAGLVRSVQGLMGLAVALEGFRRMALGRAPRLDEEGLLSKREESDW